MDSDETECQQQPVENVENKMEADEPECQAKEAERKRNNKPKFEISEDEMKEMTEAFQLFDMNGDEKLSLKELGNVLRAMGQNPTDDDLMEIMQGADENNDEFLSFEEYASLLKKHLKEPEDVKIELIEAFRHFDRDKSNTLDLKELRKILTYCGQNPLSNAEVDKFFSMMDKDGDQVVNVDEFVEFMCSKGITKD